MEVPFLLLLQTIKLKPLVMLDEGVNTFTIEVDNPCGEDEENMNVVFDPCLVPNLDFSGDMAVLVAATNNNSVSSSMPINFTIENYSASTNVVISNNGNIIPSHTYQIYNGVLNGTVNLFNGINNISIQVISPCGSDSESIVVSYVEETPAPDSPSPNIEEEEESNTNDNESNDEGGSNEDENGESTDDNESNDEGGSNGRRQWRTHGTGTRQMGTEMEMEMAMEMEMDIMDMAIMLTV